MNNKIETAYGSFVLNINSGENNRSLQAWSSADLYILDNLNSYNLAENSSILILNDNFGALTVCLSGFYKIYHMSDSLCARKECINNMKLNGINGDAVHFLNSDDAFPEEISLIALRNPKSLNFLEYQLQRISDEIMPGIPVIAADMVKNVHSSTVSLYEHYLKDVKTSLAWKKSRLIRGSSDGRREELNHFPVRYTPLDESFEITNYPNLFAHGRLDPGTAFFLSNFPYVASSNKIIDLACGDGVLALKAASKWPDSTILCVDESWLAVKSARETFEKSGFSNTVEFSVTDILEGVEKNSADLILLNPPFHSNHSLSTSTALEMFRQSADVLKEGGELFVVSNRHLGYEKQLSAMFKKVQVIKSNKKFSIIRAVK